MTMQAPQIDRRQWLSKRFELAQTARFGAVQNVAPAQRNMLLLIADRYQLDPLTDITLYQGQPFVTLDGWLKVMRRQQTYQGYACRPLHAEEKINWGYEAEDVVIECAIRTLDNGTISARGVVRAAEVKQARGRAQESNKRSAPIGIYLPEMAEKRAIARAARAAFGLEIPEESEQDRNATLAARQVEVFGSEDSWHYRGIESPRESVEEAGDFTDEPFESVPIPMPDAATLGEAAGEAIKQHLIATGRLKPDASVAEPEPTEFKCVKCDVPLRKEDGSGPIDDAEADALYRQYGALLCKADRKRR